MELEVKKPAPPPAGAQEWPDGGIKAQTVPWLKKWLLARGIKQSKLRNQRKAELIEMWIDEFFRLDDEEEEQAEVEKERKKKEGPKPISASGSARRVKKEDVEVAVKPKLLKAYTEYKKLLEEFNRDALDYEGTTDMFNLATKVQKLSMPEIRTELLNGYFTQGDWVDNKMTNVKKVYFKYFKAGPGDDRLPQNAAGGFVLKEYSRGDQRFDKSDPEQQPYRGWFFTGNFKFYEDAKHTVGFDKYNDMPMTLKDKRKRWGALAVALTKGERWRTEHGDDGGSDEEDGVIEEIYGDHILSIMGPKGQKGMVRSLTESILFGRKKAEKEHANIQIKYGLHSKNTQLMRSKANLTPEKWREWEKLSLTTRIEKEAEGKYTMMLEKHWPRGTRL